MTLKEIKDWMKQNIVECEHWKINVYDNGRDKAICVRDLITNQQKIAIGGLRNTTTAVKGISIIIHWNKNPDETERIAKSVYDLFHCQQPVINETKVVLCNMKNDSPISLGIDENGIYEYVIEVILTYNRERKEL